MLNGVLNPHEPHSLAVIRGIVGKVLGRANIEGQKVYFSVPAATAEGDPGISYHEASMKLILKDLGYAPTAIAEGLAVVFGELGASNFTGIGVSCGSGLCNACLAVLSVPVLTFAVPKAGDFIDSQAAAVTGDLATRLRVIKEGTFRLNGLTAGTVLPMH